MSETARLQNSAETRPRPSTHRNKVPEVTAYFWIIKVLCTTVGETAPICSTTRRAWV
ncbi:hypothetical protein ACWD7C_38530 [Streptomyces sp. NPDC005134]